MKKTKRVCVIGDRYGKGGRDRLSGVLRYASDNPSWYLDVITLGTPGSTDKLRQLLSTSYDGNLILLSCDRETADIVSGALTRNRLTGKVMTVDLNPVYDKLLPRSLDVKMDSENISRQTMRLLIRRGYASFAYVGYRSEQQLSQERHDALQKIAAADGYPFTATNETTDISQLARWLQSLPKPCGIIAYYDMLSRDVLDACRLARIKVPEHVAIVGSDDDPSICEATRPTLTSALPDFENGVYRAAAEFDKQISRRTSVKKRKRMTYGIVTITERESTTDLHGGGLLVSTACEYIRLHAATRMSVPQVADFCKVSQRLLELRFREILGRNIRAEIERIRLRSVCSLLQGTNLPLNDVCRRAGFSAPAYLCTLFKKKFGCTMREYRSNTATWPTPPSRA